MALSVTGNTPRSGVVVYTYDNLDTLDTLPQALSLNGTTPLAGFMQVVGTFGGGTVKLQGSNNGDTWVDLKDVTGTTIEITSAGGAEFTTSALHIRPLIVGGTGDDVDVTICLRG